MRSRFFFETSGLAWGNWLEYLRGVIKNSQKELGLSYEEVAREAELCLNTVLRFVDRWSATKRPHENTLRALGEVAERHWRGHKPISVAAPVVVAAPAALERRERRVRKRASVPAWRVSVRKRMRKQQQLRRRRFRA